MLFLPPRSMLRVRFAGHADDVLQSSKLSNFGPCGDMLDRKCALLMRHIERRYPYFQPVAPPVEECLLVPFNVQDEAVGTIGAVAHDFVVGPTT